MTERNATIYRIPLPNVMRPKRRRRLLQLGGLLALAWLVLVGPWWHGWVGTWNRAWSDVAPAVAADRALRAAAAALPEQAPIGPLQAGCAVVDLTDRSLGLPLAGYANRVFRPSEGVADAVSTRAVVFDNGPRRVAIVSAELLIVNRTLVDAVMAKLRLRDASWRRADVFFSATHTHSAPGGYPSTFLETFGLGMHCPAVVDRLADRMAGAVLAAQADLQPCELATVAAEVDARLIRNRTVKSDSANRWLDLLIVRKRDSTTPLATVVVFGAHATCRRSSDRRMSGDYPGVCCRAIEQAVGGTCVFLAGAVGSMAPPDDAVPRDRLAEWFGTELAGQAVPAIRAARGFREQVAIEALGFQAPLPPPEAKVGRDWRLSPIVAGALLPKRAWVHGLRLGNLVLMGTPADYSGVLAERLRGADEGVTTVVTSFDGDYIGYVLPDEYHDLPRYEPRSMSFFGPRAGSFFQEVLASTAQRLAR